MRLTYNTHIILPVKHCMMAPGSFNESNLGFNPGEIEVVHLEIQLQLNNKADVLVWFADVEPQTIFVVETVNDELLSGRHGKVRQWVVDRLHPVVPPL